jgi:hypothetical protein
MTADILPGQPASPVAPAEREAGWTLWVRFAIEAGSQQEVRVVTGQALAGLEMELPLRGEPTIQPLGLRDGIWVATAEPDLTGLQSIEPDDAATRVRYVCSRFGTDVLWTARATGHQAKWEWPPDIWSRRPGKDDVLLHPAVLAAIIWCEAK